MWVKGSAGRPHWCGRGADGGPHAHTRRQARGTGALRQRDVYCQLIALEAAAAIAHVLVHVVAQVCLYLVLFVAASAASGMPWVCRCMTVRGGVVCVRGLPKCSTTTCCCCTCWTRLARCQTCTTCQTLTLPPAAAAAAAGAGRGGRAARRVQRAGGELLPAAQAAGRAQQRGREGRQGEACGRGQGGAAQPVLLHVRVWSLLVSVAELLQPVHMYGSKLFCSQPKPETERRQAIQGSGSASVMLELPASCSRCHTALITGAALRVGCRLIRSGRATAAPAEQ